MKVLGTPSKLLLAFVITGTLVTSGCEKTQNAIDRFRSPSARAQSKFKRGQKFMGDKKYREAMIMFGQALRDDPKWAEAHYQRGMASLEAKEFATAYKEFQAAVANDPKHYLAVKQLASMDLLAKKYEEAKEAAEKMLGLKPGDSAAEEIF